MRTPVVLSTLVLFWMVAPAISLETRAAPSVPARETAAERIFVFGSRDEAAFAREARRAKALGATHVSITGDLPPAMWEFNPPDDPYPAWYVTRPDFLKIFPPKEVQPYVDMTYAKKVAAILEARCEVLRKLGLKAYWSSNEPQVMPEAFFTANPELRGPRVDQPNRSRVPHFAPCVDRPEMLRLYREAMQNLLRHCPEVDVFNFLTTDSGSGFCWSPGLYPGKNGPSFCEDRPMAQRVAGFLIDLQQAAHDAGHSIEICINGIQPRPWMRASFTSPMSIVHRLRPGLAVQNMEGPAGRPFLRHAAFAAGGSPFYPVVGIAFPPMGSYPPGPTNRAGPAARELVDLGDEAAMAANAGLYRALSGRHPGNGLARLTDLRDYAVSLVGDKQADTLMALWSSLNQVHEDLNALNFGPMLRMGMVLGRWIDRPLVPFPSDLTAEETGYYRPYLFQAKGEAQAEDLADIQAMRMYEGWGAHLLFQRVITLARPALHGAIADAERLAGGAGPRERWELLHTRLEVLDCLLQTADDVVAYQAQLDRVKRLGRKPEPNPVLGTRSSWGRTDLMGIARREIDNATRLRGLLQSTPAPLIDEAATPAGEWIMKLSPDLPAQLKRKIDIMNSKWEDYKRLFTAPNP